MSSTASSAYPQCDTWNHGRCSCPCPCECEQHADEQHGEEETPDVAW